MQKFFCCLEVFTKTTMNCRKAAYVNGKGGGAEYTFFYRSPTLFLNIGVLIIEDGT